MRTNSSSCFCHLGGFVAALILTVFVVNVRGIQNVSGSSQMIPLIQKNARVTVNNWPDPADREIIIDLRSLKISDTLNLRPSDEMMVSVKAGTLIQTINADGTISIPFVPLKPGVPLPESSLEVSERTIIFTRPETLEEDNTVFLDVQIPRIISARILVNEQLVLSEYLQQPLSYRDKQWGLGYKNVSGVAALASKIIEDKNREGCFPVYDIDRRGYILSYSCLKIIKQPHINNSAGTDLILLLQIDENGKVLIATPLAGGHPENLQELIKEWQFDPYRLGGQTVPVITVIHIRTQ